jgi:hypothetical protein
LGDALGAEAGAADAAALTQSQAAALLAAGEDALAVNRKRAAAAAPLLAREAGADAAARAHLFRAAGREVESGVRAAAGARARSARALAYAMRLAAAEDLPLVAPRIAGAYARLCGFSPQLPARALAPPGTLAAGPRAVTPEAAAAVLAEFSRAAGDAYVHTEERLRGVRVAAMIADAAAAVAAAKK